MTAPSSRGVSGRRAFTRDEPSTSPTRRRTPAALLGTLALLAGSFGFTSDAWATPAAIFGAGPESQALGGTGTSFARGVAASRINPAGLSRSTSKQFAFGVHAANYTLEATPGPKGAHHDATQAVLFGVVVPLPLFEPVADRVALGLGVSSPGSSIARVSILAESRPQFPLLAARADALNLDLGLGVRLPWGLRIGIGTGLLASLQGKINIDAGGESARSVTDDELVLTTAPVIGVQYRASEALEFGLVARSALSSAFDLDVRFQNLGQLVVPPLHVTGLAGFDPAELNFEAVYDLDTWRLIAGVGHKAWSAIETLREPTVQCPASERPCGALVAHELKLRSTWIPRLGLQHSRRPRAGIALALRAGYFYEPTPLPAQTGAARVLDNPRHAFTAGYALTFERLGLELQGAAQWHQLVLRKHSLRDAGRAFELESSGAIASICFALGGQF